jgi:hypothetical protein
VTPARIDVAAWARIVWLGVAFVLFGIGVGLVWWPASQQVGQRRAHARELYDEANDIDDATRRAVELRAAKSQVETDLRLLGGMRSDGAVTAALLRLFHDEAKRTGVEIREVAPDTEQHATASAALLKPGALGGYELAIGVRGPFRNVVSLLADLPRHDVLIDVHDVQLASPESERSVPVLDVTLHSTIYRVLAVPGGEVSHVRALR